MQEDWEDNQKPAVILLALERDKFAPDFYRKQLKQKERLAADFAHVLYLDPAGAKNALADVDGADCLFITSSDVLAAELLQQGYAVVGLETAEGELKAPPVVLWDLEAVSSRELAQMFCRQRGIPWKVMETKRCVLRELALDDVDELFALYEKPGMTEFVEPLFAPEQEREYQKNYIKYVYGLYGFGMWLVFDRASGELIGRAGIEVTPYCGAQEAELGYVFAPEVRRQGYATEVCRKIMEYAKKRLGLKGLICRVDERNILSQRLLEKLGFSNVEKETYRISF